MSRSKYLVIIPCFNESESIGSVLAEIAALPVIVDTLVIDDGSTDNTYEVAKSSSLVIRLISNLGIGGAVQTGFIYADQHHYDCAIQVDGDGQHPASEIPKLISLWEETSADLVIGTRFLDISSFQSSFFRRIGINVISKILSHFYGQSFTDPTSGYRLYGKRAIQLFAKRYPRDFPEPISIATSMENHFQVVEVPVRMNPRSYGQSSISGLKNLIYMVRVLGYITLHRMSRFL